MTAARITWNGQDLPAVAETIRLGAVETTLEVPDFDDAELRQFVAALGAIDRFEGAGLLAPDYTLERGAILYDKHGGTLESWRDYLVSLAVPESRTKPAKSRLQPFFKWAHGGKRDTTGRLSELSATLDEWVELGDKRPSPVPVNGPCTSPFAAWLSENHGYTNIAAMRRSGRVWVVNPYGIEWVYASREDAERGSRADIGCEIPIYGPEPAENFDLEGFEPTGPEYRRDDDNEPRPYRIKGRRHPRAILDSYSEGISSRRSVATGAVRYSESQSEGAPDPEPNEKRYIRVPPELYQALDDEFHFDFDPFPDPRPDFDALTVPWGQSNFVNPEFRRKYGSPTAAVHKGIAEHKNFGKQSVFLLSVPSYINYLLEAGAELRSAKRPKWLEVDTREPCPSPSSAVIAILHGVPTAAAAIADGACEDKCPSPKTPLAGSIAASETDRLKRRIAELEAENAALKARLAETETPPDSRSETSS